VTRPNQLEILRDASTDAGVIQPARDGVPSGGVPVPCRHLHSPSEMVDMTDVKTGVKLLVQLVKKPIVISEE
jgi:tetrahedral aminopeptidase